MDLDIGLLRFLRGTFNRSRPELLSEISRIYCQITNITEEGTELDTYSFHKICQFSCSWMHLIVMVMIPPVSNVWYLTSLRDDQESTKTIKSLKPFSLRFTFEDLKTSVFLLSSKVRDKSKFCDCYDWSILQFHCCYADVICDSFVSHLCFILTM